MTVAASMGSQSRLSFAAAGTPIGSYTEIYGFANESLAKTLTLLDTQEISGTRSHIAGRSIDGPYSVAGQINLPVTPTTLNGAGATANCVLSRILGGGAPSANVYSLGETLPFFDTLIERIAQRFVYGNCKVNKAIFKGKASGLLELSLDLIGETETLSSTAFPALGNATDAPYAFQHASTGVTLESLGPPITDFELTIDNHLTARFSNSQTATDLYPTDRTVSLKATIPFTTDWQPTLYGINSANAAAASIVFTNGAHALTFTIGLLQVPDKSPLVKSKGEIFLELNGVAKKTGSTMELSITST